MFSTPIPYGRDAEARNNSRTAAVTQRIDQAVAELRDAIADLETLVAQITNNDYWSIPEGGVNLSLAQGRVDTVGRTVAQAQRRQWRANESLLAAVAAAGGYEITRED